jgi:hypothetical protein
MKFLYLIIILGILSLIIFNIIIMNADKIYWWFNKSSISNNKKTKEVKK